MKTNNAVAVLVSVVSLSAVGWAQSLTDGLVAYYPLNGTAHDVSSNERHGLASNVTPTQDRFGRADGALAFNGTERMPTTSSLWLHDSLLSLGSGYTVSLWFNPASNKANQTLFNTSPHTGLAISYNHGYAPGHVSLFIGSANAFWDAQAIHGPKNDYQIGTWTHMTFTKSEDDYSLFINGTLDTTFHLANDYSLNVGALVGTLDDGGSEVFHGGLDEVRIYNRALSGDEVRELYRMESVPEPATYAMLAGLGLMGFAAVRRLRRAQ